MKRIFRAASLIEVAHARNLLLSAGGEPWTCAACGERLEGQFDSCWRCGAERRV